MGVGLQAVSRRSARSAGRGWFARVRVFSKKLLRRGGGALAERVGVVGQRAVGLAGGGWRSRGTDGGWGRFGE